MPLSSVERMSKEYDAAPSARKRELQDMLAARNQQLNNYQQVNMCRMGKLREEKMQGIADKVNVFIAEYGDKHGCAIIFGTAACGSILYGNRTS